MHSLRRSETTMSKPIVKFSGGMDTQWLYGEDSQGKMIYALIANLSQVEGHPKLGNQGIVHTSKVEKITIETRNTIYEYVASNIPLGETSAS